MPTISLTTSRTHILPPPARPPPFIRAPALTELRMPRSIRALPMANPQQLPGHRVLLTRTLLLEPTATPRDNWLKLAGETPSLQRDHSLQSRPLAPDPLT